MLEDIAILTGGNVISEELGRKLDSVDLKTSVVLVKYVLPKKKLQLLTVLVTKLKSQLVLKSSKNKSLKLLPISIKKNYKNVLLNYLVA